VHLSFSFAIYKSNVKICVVIDHQELPNVLSVVVPCEEKKNIKNGRLRLHTAVWLQDSSQGYTPALSVTIALLRRHMRLVALY